MPACHSKPTLATTVSPFEEQSRWIVRIREPTDYSTSIAISPYQTRETLSKIPTSHLACSRMQAALQPPITQPTWSTISSARKSCDATPRPGYPLRRTDRCHSHYRWRYLPAGGLDGKLERIRWKRFTSGLHEPMTSPFAKVKFSPSTETPYLKILDTDGNGRPTDTS